jgi:LPS-assembly lipoprotein
MGKLAAHFKDWYWTATWPSLSLISGVAELRFCSGDGMLRGTYVVKLGAVSAMRKLTVLAMLLVIAGCGYRPLYATDESGMSIATELSNIAIQETGTRIGQQIRNRLVSTMRPAGQEGQDTYRLVLTPVLADTVQADQGLMDVNGRRGIKRSQVRLIVSFDLYDQRTGKVVKSGKSFSNVGYDILYEPIADRQAKANATERSVLEVSTDIRTRLAAYMASRTG